MDTLEAALSASREELAAGHRDEALALARRALAIDPHSAGAAGLAGAILALADRPLEARVQLELAVSLDPSRAELWNNLGGVQRLLGDEDGALRSFATALALVPEYADAFGNLAEAMHRSRAYGPARAALEPLVQRHPSHGALRRLLGIARWRCGDADGAQACLRQALELDPTDAAAWSGLGALLTELGAYDEAVRCLRRAIELDPTQSTPYRLLAEHDARLLGAADIEALRRLCDDAVPDGTRADARFALARIETARGDVRASFAHLVAANRDASRYLPYDEEAALGPLREIARHFDAALMGRTDLAHPTRRPIFIFGMPRSGTTLVEQILASHPLVHAGGELTLLDEIASDEIARTGAFSRRVAERYDDALAALAPSAEIRVTDKLPANFRFAGLIHLTMPRAIMIHVRRDPLDVGLSCFSNAFEDPALAWATDLARIGRYYRAYATLMAHWRAVLPAERMLEVEYETLVGDFEAQVRRIVAHCELPWDAACLRFHATRRLVRTASSSQVFRPLYASSVRASRAYGGLLDPLRRALGEYAPTD